MFQTVPPIGEHDPERKRRLAVDLALLSIELGLDMMWRWQHVTYTARSASARRLQRWAIVTASDAVLMART